MLDGEVFDVVTGRLRALGVEGDVIMALRYLMSADSVRRRDASRVPLSAAYTRAREVEATIMTSFACTALLLDLEKATPRYHPGFETIVLIPSRLFDATHSWVPRPVDPVKNSLFYCGNPHKRGFMWKIPMTVRVWDGAVIYVGQPVPGSVADVRAPPVSREPHLCDLGYVGGAFAAVVGVKRPPRGELTDEQRQYNSALSSWRAVAECVNGRLKEMFPRLKMWRGRDEDGRVLHAAWMLAAMAHNIYIARHPLVLPDRRWSWLLSATTLPSSDPWLGGVPAMIGSGSYRGLPPMPIRPDGREQGDVPRDN